MTLKRILEHSEYTADLARVTVRVENFDKESACPYVGQFLIDTHAADCIAPTPDLKRAGVREEGELIFKLADGQKVKRHYGFVWISFMGKVTMTRIIFGPAWTEPVLGVLALEGMGLRAETISASLKQLAEARALRSEEMS